MTVETSEGKIGYSSLANFSSGDILMMLKDLPDACCIFKVLTDPFGTVKDMLFLFANEKYAKLVGVSTAELIGSTYFDTVKNRDEDWVKFSYSAAILRQSTILRTYNSEYDKWFEFWAVPVYQKGFCAFIIHDVTATKRNEDDAALTFNTNNLVIDCAKELSSAEFGKGIKKVLKILCKTIEADRVYLMELNGSEIGAMHEFISESGTAKYPTKKDYEKYGIVKIGIQHLQKKRTLVVNDTATVETDYQEFYNDILIGNVHRFVVTALLDKNKIIGYLVADNHAIDKQIDVVQVMESVAIFLAYELRNRSLTNEMLYLGSHDALTDLGNRYSLNQTLMALSKSTSSVGVCYSDINGLKLINDENGHEQGDETIKSVAAAFASVFKKKNCFRIGGDEFIAIIPDIQEEKFNDMVEKFRAKNKKSTVAVGSVWVEDSKDLKNAVKLADEAMYNDKAMYYAQHERRRI